MTTEHDEIYDDGILRVEHDNYYVACRGQRVYLPLKNFLLLSRLARNPGRLVTARELWQHTWGNHEPMNRDTLRVHIYRLRQKLAPFGITIANMSKVGYCLYASAAAGKQSSDVG
ncbi:MAG TPA: helix-turn-helix domain-containing protein [Blastocatellia bacterium]|nr:helix-turn-helix domain-containing protein [Blastocatellia bacterium]